MRYISIFIHSLSSLSRPSRLNKDMLDEKPFCLQHRLKEGKVAFNLLILLQLAILSTTQAEKGQVAFSLLILIQLASLFTTQTKRRPSAIQFVNPYSAGQFVYNTGWKRPSGIQFVNPYSAGQFVYNTDWKRPSGIQFVNPYSADLLQRGVSHIQQLHLSWQPHDVGVGQLLFCAELHVKQELTGCHLYGKPMHTLDFSQPVRCLLD